MSSPNRPHGDPKPIADASSLFDTGEIPIVPPKPPLPQGEPDLGTDEIRVVNWSPPPEAPAPVADLDDGYGLIGGPAEVAEEAPPRPVALPTPEKKVRRAVEPQPVETRKKRPADAIEEIPEPPRRRRKGVEIQSDENAEAYPLWSRAAEWGGTAVQVAAAGAGTIFVAYLLTGVSWSFALLTLMAGLAGAILLSYPILVTMERPVRVTPEQAVKDFYAAASHHFPHYKRMWLLLSSAGRESVPSHSFGEFRSAWERRVATWKGAKVKRFAPLDFQVQDFRADKSVGQTTVWAEYTLRVRPRDQPGGEPLASIRMAHGLVKGDDRMWYLNRGLPNPDGDA